MNYFPMTMVVFSLVCSVSLWSVVGHFEESVYRDFQITFYGCEGCGEECGHQCGTCHRKGCTECGGCLAAWLEATGCDEVCESCGELCASCAEACSECGAACSDLCTCDS